MNDPDTLLQAGEPPLPRPAEAKPDPYALDSSSIKEPPTNLFKALRQIGPGLILAGSIVGTGELIATTSLGTGPGCRTSRSSRSWAPLPARSATPTCGRATSTSEVRGSPVDRPVNEKGARKGAFLFVA